MKIRNSVLFIFMFTALLLVFAVSAHAQGFNYITVEEFKARLDAGDHENGKMAIVTTQTQEEYTSGHLKAAYPTFARPLKSDADFAKLHPFMELVKDTDSDIVLICPRGKSGAELPYNYFKENGISEDRMLILRDGQEAFNKAFPDYVSYGN
jgi:rhodanese-related sulfurtransferase